MSEDSESATNAERLPVAVKVGCPKCGHFTMAATERGSVVMCRQCNTKLLQFGSGRFGLMTITPFAIER